MSLSCRIGLRMVTVVPGLDLGRGLFAVEALLVEPRHASADGHLANSSRESRLPLCSQLSLVSNALRIWPSMPAARRPGLKQGRYGFRDHLALGDADFIVGPLTRTTAACFTARPLPPVLVKTRKLLDATNAIFLRAALEEIACHPDDAKALRQTHSRLDRLPPTLLMRRL